MGLLYTRGLFFEEADSKDTVLYTLKDEDHNGFPSLYRLFMASPDEYTFSVSHLNGWDHFVTLSECTWFVPYIKRWRAEIQARHKCQAQARLEAVAADPTHKEYFQANKLLFNASRKPAGVLKRGAPSRAEVQAEITHQASVERQIEQDMSRVLGNA